MKIRIVSAAAAALMLTTLAALPHSGAAGVVKQRMDMMEAISVGMKAVAGMIRGIEPFDADRAAAAASAIADHASNIPRMFPEGSIAGPSEASAEIWDDWERFIKLSRRMQMEALSLAETAAAAEDSAILRPQFHELGRTCIACHEAFRKNR